MSYLEFFSDHYILQYYIFTSNNHTNTGYHIAKKQPSYRYKISYRPQVTIIPLRDIISSLSPWHNVTWLHSCHSLGTVSCHIHTTAYYALSLLLLANDPCICISSGTMHCPEDSSARFHALSYTCTLCTAWRLSAELVHLHTMHCP